MDIQNKSRDELIRELEELWGEFNTLKKVVEMGSAASGQSDLFSRLFYINPSACALLDDESHCFIEVNEAFCQLLNYEKDDLIGKTPESAGLLTSGVLKDLYAKTNGTNRLINEEVVYKAQNGTLKQIILSSETLCVGERKYRFIVINDITELSHTKEELARSKVRIEETEFKFKQVFDNTLDHIFIIDYTSDKRFRVVTVNPIQEKETGGLRPGSFIEDCLDEETCKHVLINYSRCVREQKILTYEENFYGRDFLTQLIPIKDSEGIVYRIIGIARNITNEKMLTRQLMLQNERLRLLNAELTLAKDKAEESDGLKSSFLHNMSHEIRTPMNAIVGFSQLLGDNFNDKGKLQQFTNIINQRCNDLLILIDEILDIAKIESGQVTVNIEACNLSALFDDLSIVFKEQQAEQGKEHIRFNLKASCDASRLIVATDKMKLKEIFTNLIENAFKFTDEGVIEGGCKMDSDGKMIYYVSDSGIGIPAEKQQLVFDRFVQLQQNPEKLYGGTGLGLSIVKGLIDLLGGKIWLESEFRKGTAFYFTLPDDREKLKHHEPVEVDEHEDGNLLEGKNILVVEDDTYNAEYINEILAHSGSHIFHAQYGREALKIVNTQPLDLVLMDIGLPDINGYEVTQQIKKLQPDLLVIAQTAYAAAEDKQKSLESGCVDYISKPLKSKALLSLMNRHLARMVH
jgi:PAS domain S-box-containing protein